MGSAKEEFYLKTIYEMLPEKLEEGMTTLEITKRVKEDKKVNLHWYYVKALLFELAYYHKVIFFKSRSYTLWYKNKDYVEMIE